MQDVLRPRLCALGRGEWAMERTGIAAIVRQVHQNKHASPRAMGTARTTLRLSVSNFGPASRGLNWAQVRLRKFSGA